MCWSGGSGPPGRTPRRPPAASRGLRTTTANGQQTRNSALLSVFRSPPISAPSSSSSTPSTSPASAPPAPLGGAKGPSEERVTAGDAPRRTSPYTPTRRHRLRVRPRTRVLPRCTSAGQRTPRDRPVHAHPWDRLHLHPHPQNDRRAGLSISPACRSLCPAVRSAGSGVGVHTPERLRDRCLLPLSVHVTRRLVEAIPLCNQGAVLRR